jgi:hypothetical protein
LGGGEGVLIYPGLAANRDVNIPIASIRLKNLTDGMEDLAYLKMADELGLSGALNSAQNIIFYRRDLPIHSAANIFNAFTAEACNQKYSDARKILGDALSASGR